MQKQKDTNWIHFTGIAGVTLAPLAIELKKIGYKITGSDTDIYDPIKSLLERADIDFKLSYSYEHLFHGDSVPHLVVTGAAVSPKNKELLFAKKQNIAVKHFAEVLEELVIEENSVVVAGTYAKTTITAMLVKILIEAGKDISYMFGGVPVDGTNSVKLQTGRTLLSVVEGDEYIASRWDKQSKFFFYHPKYLILTGVKWDHTDVFKTEADYIENFKALVRKIPEDGVLFANVSDENVMEVVKIAKCKVLTFDETELQKWAEENKIEVSILGAFNELNAMVAAKFSIEVLGLDLEVVRNALKNFEGIKRRLEVKYSSPEAKLQNAKIVVLDDFASSPPKVKGAIKAIKEEFPKHKLVIVYEPNTGNRTKAALKGFKDVFSGVDLVVLPKFKDLIKSETEFLTENEFDDALRNEVKVLVRNNDEDLVNELLEQIKSGKTVVVFMSSQAMEERIRSLISKL